MCKQDLCIPHQGEQLWVLHYHRLMEWVWFEGTFKGQLGSNPSAVSRDFQNLPLHQVAQTPIQPDCKYFHSFSGHLTPVFHHLHCKKFLPNTYSKSTLLQFKIYFVLLQQSSSPSFLEAPFRYWKGLEGFPGAFSSPENQPISLSLSPQQRCSSPWNIFVASSGLSHSRSISFLCWKCQNWIL